MDTQRIIALVVFSVSGVLLWEAWQKHTNPPVRTPAAQTQAAETKGTTLPATASLPSGAPGAASVPSVSAPASTTPTETKMESGKPIRVKTDVLDVTLDTAGADLRTVVLSKHYAKGDKSRALTLMHEKAGTYYVTQTGLLGAGLPNHVSAWTTAQDNYDLGNEKTLKVVFEADAPNGAKVRKTFTFTRDSYVVDVTFDVQDAEAGNAYFQFLRDANPPEGETAGNNPLTSGALTFTGPAAYTEAKKYQKVAFSDIDKGKFELQKEATDGWIGMVQHYFVAAWLPKGNTPREFFIKKVTDKLYSTGVVVPVVKAGDTASVTMPLYIGPQEQEDLKKLAPGLELVVDYGWLTVLAYPMFAILAWIQGLVGNWGWTIIIFTILIKLVFFPLNQKAGKSMAHMKQLTPKIEAMKARYGDDKVKMNQAMMELYRTEKINPLGGCLPILVQMPFFIALYWVLLGAVELRGAPWLGWITDLSTPDPYWILPIIMGASMFVQTKLNPAPADPVQAKVMLIMPLVFSVMFFFFPSGLVLYWTVQNLLGILQQWYINKTIDGDKPSKPAK